MKKQTGFIAIAVVLALAILACGGVTSTTQPSNVLFQDDFSSNNSGWDSIRVEGEGVTDYEDGIYRVQVLTTDTTVWANPNLDFTDVQIEVEATKAGGPDDNDFGILCRYQDESNYYFFVISSDGYYGIGKVKDGTQTLIDMQDDLMETNDSINQGAATNRIRADCTGSTLTLFVNGEEVASKTDADFTSGDVGLTAGTFAEAGTDIHFDNFKVFKP